MFLNNRKRIIIGFGILAIISTFFLFKLKFSFNFEQFFPQGDDDLAFFQEFIKEFESDDNFLLIAINNDPSVFETEFLTKLDQLTKSLRKVDMVTSVQSLTNFNYPIKTPFGISTIPAIHLDDPTKLPLDSIRIMQDERLVQNLISKDASATTILLKTVDYMDLAQSEQFMKDVEQIFFPFEFEEYHFLGRAYFMNELSDMQYREVMVSSIVSIILVFLILVFLFRKPIGIFIALFSIGLSLLIFMGILGMLGRELNAMAAFYPVLMLIVGTSDVIHIFTKYIDELGRGKAKELAIMITIKEIGWATLLTSLTTAAGFLSLLTSKVTPIRDFGINSALGVIVAYITVVSFTTALLSLFSKESIIKDGKQQVFWDKLMTTSYFWNRHNPIKVLFSTLVFLAICAYGISLISTNYKIKTNLPIGEKITEDFDYFEEEFGGFRPMEFAITMKDDNKLTDPVVIQNIEKLEQRLNESEHIQNVFSITGIYKSIHRMMNNNKVEFYTLPDTNTIKKYRRYISKLPKSSTAILISKDKNKTRISAKINDLGAETIKGISLELDDWVENNIDTSLMDVRQTGTGVIVEKNSEYLRDNLILGLGLALLIVSVLMMVLFKDWKFLFISLVPNILPLIFTASILGFFGIELEATISIIFAIVFGIAVDDTIHFLSKYKLSFERTKDKELAIQQTFEETGKAILFTSIILFFGFLVMLFSIHPPSVTIGTLISFTLISAVVADLMLIPWLIRKLT